MKPIISRSSRATPAAGKVHFWRHRSWRGEMHPPVWNLRPQNETSQVSRTVSLVGKAVFIEFLNVLLSRPQWKSQLWASWKVAISRGNSFRYLAPRWGSKHGGYVQQQKLADFGGHTGHSKIYDRPKVVRWSLHQDGSVKDLHQTHLAATEFSVDHGRVTMSLLGPEGGGAMVCQAQYLQQTQQKSWRLTEN
jgi:hypothetical protein